jgi:hypothetical protein
VVEDEIGGEGEGGGGGMGGGRTNLNRDGVDLSFKLRSPSKITFDMNAGYLDKKIKIYYFRSTIRMPDPKFERKYAKLNMLFKKHVKMLVTTILSSILYFNLCIM